MDSSNEIEVIEWVEIDVQPITQSFARSAARQSKQC
jgi:hypothetical protein